MKQYTTPEQTAKLIELGFEKPKNTQYVQRIKTRNLYSPFVEFEEPEFEGSYSIGELIEILPTYIDSIFSKLVIQYYIDKWKVSYNNLHSDSSEYETREVELIDALFDMLVKLKEEGVI